MESLLIVGAHALDAEVMAGGLAAALARRGGRVVILHITRGERGHPSKPPQQFAQQLEEEMAAAAEALGVQGRWAGLPAPVPHPSQVAPLIVEAVQAIGAKAVVTHWRGSWHPSHRRTYQAVVMALRSMAAASRPVLLFGENCEDLTGFRPNWFAVIEDVYEVWLKALTCYELFRLSVPPLQAPIPYWAYYTAAARVRGLQIGRSLAQAFMCRGESPPEGLDLVRPSVRALSTFRGHT